MSGRRVVAALLAMLLGAALISVLPGALLASADGAPSGSAVTVSGQGEFANLKVTVSQTENLINQTVKVSWSGGAPTVRDDAANFLQIMQCWGDDLKLGPDPTQCQFGAIRNQPPQARFNVRTRTISTPDPAQEVPFWPVGGPRPTGLVIDSTSVYYDAQVTNEVPVAGTRPDGRGEVDFEIQTVGQSVGLGCGDPIEANGKTTGRSCWLVIVPRGTKEPDGTVPVAGLTTSPFEPATWDKKIAVPLKFLPQGRPCPIGAPERRLGGHEVVVDAVSRWQPVLCENGGALYSLTQLSDEVVRSQLLDASDPGLGLISNPVSADHQRPDRPLVYAPVAASGLAFAFNIVANPPGLTTDDPRRGVAGRPFTEMKLTPRLVAKLLTQSYQGDIPGGLKVPAGQVVPPRPVGLTNDPEFLALNPGFLADLNPALPDADRNLLSPNLHVDVLVQLVTSDLTALLWDWVLADPDARAFVDGKADPSAMVVNEANKGLRPPVTAYPRNDQSCVPLSAGNGNGKYPFCAGDEHPFANDMHEAARAVSRGDPLGLDPTAPNVTPDGRVTFGKKPRQPVTARALIAVVDAVTADRYQLPTATLRNAAGQFVAPDAAGLQAGLDAMKPSAVRGVLQPDPATSNPAAYPLTSLSYAATSPPALTADEGRDYATFVRYAVGLGQQPGQLPGQLPLGYLPLPEPLRQQALAAATIIETQAGKSIVGASAPPAAANGPGATVPDLSGRAAPNSSSPGGTSPNAAPAPAPARTGVVAAPSPAAASPPVAQKPVTDSRRTPSLPAPAVGALLLTILICGALAATSSPVLQSQVIYRLGAAVRGRVRGGVRPPEQ
jgi:hypothetical protein